MRERDYDRRYIIVDGASLPKNENNRVLYFDVLNILAAVSVVWIHFGNEVHWYDNSKAWYWCLFIQVICYWAVPVFFMLTGATLLGYRSRYSTNVFFKKRLFRTVLPYLFWGTVCIFIKSHTQEGFSLIQESEKEYPFRYLVSILDVFLNNKMEPIYWFFPALFGIYLCMPALSVFADKKYRGQLNYLVFVGILTIAVIPFGFAMLKEHLGYDIVGWNNAMALPMLSSFLLYPILGYWASTHNFNKGERILCYIAAICSLLIRYFGLRTLSVRDGATNALYMNYMSFPALFLALGVFVFIRYFCERHDTTLRKIQSPLSKIASCSLGIYLIHNLVINFMAKIPFFGKYTLRWYFIWPLFCYLFCLLVVYIVKKIPVIKHIFP